MTLQLYTVLSDLECTKIKKLFSEHAGRQGLAVFLFPFTHIELGNAFKLDKALVRGTLPPIIGISTKDAFRTLTTYVQTYLKEEILDEAIVRNIGAFSRFLVILETFRLMHYAERPYRMYHWRSSHGAEVNLVIETVDSLWAVEIKSFPQVRPADLSGLKSFAGDYKNSKPLCASTTDTPYLAGKIPVIPWKYLFRRD